MFPTKQKTFKAGILTPSSRRNQHPNKEVTSKLGCECHTTYRLISARFGPVIPLVLLKGVAHTAHAAPARSTGLPWPSFYAQYPPKPLANVDSNYVAFRVGGPLSPGQTHQSCPPLIPLVGHVPAKALATRDVRLPWSRETPPWAPRRAASPEPSQVPGLALHNSPPDRKQAETSPRGRKTRTTQEASARSRGDSTSRLGHTDWQTSRASHSEEGCAEARPICFSLSCKRPATIPKAGGSTEQKYRIVTETE